MELFIGLLLLVVTLLIGLPVPFAFMLTTIYYIFSLNYDPSFLIPYGFSKLNNIVLLAIPLFIIAGGLMDRGGIAKRIVDFAELFVGKIKGGTGIMTVVACAIFGAITGSGAAALASLGPILIPRLAESGYSRGFASSLISSASILGLLIPPSAIMILYAWVGNQSVLAAFLSTVIPGLILAALLIIINLIYMRKREVPVVHQEAVDPSLSGFARVRRTTISAIPALLMPFLVLGGIYGGVMTPTEAAAVSALYAIPVGFLIYRKLTGRKFYETLVEAAVSTGVIMIMIFGSMLLSRIFITENLPVVLKELMLSISDNKYVLMFMINLFLIIIGMIMDDVSAVLLATPLLLPIVVGLGIDPIHFAAILGVNLGIGLLTPPAAPLLYLGGRVGKTPIAEMLGPTAIMILFAWIPTLVITTVFPQVALFLPNLILGR